MWNVSRVRASSSHMGHANLCIITMLVYAPSKQVQTNITGECHWPFVPTLCSAVHRVDTMYQHDVSTSVFNSNYYKFFFIKISVTAKHGSTHGVFLLMFSSKMSL